MIFRTIITAFQFLTIIPIRTNRKISENDVYNSSSFFPLIGTMQGLFLALPAFLFLKIMPASIAAAFTLIFSVLITGGFHQDGLSDTFDALSIKSSGDRENDRKRRLQAMKDSTVGPMGVIAIVLSLLLKYLLMNETLQIYSGNEKYIVFFLVPLFSKWVMVTSMYRTKSARNDGMGRIFLEHTGLKQICIATGLLLVIVFLILYVFSQFLSSSLQFGYGSFTLFLMFSMVFIYLTGFVLKYIFTARFGGLTGDNFGAIHEISELLFLTIMLLQKY